MRSITQMAAASISIVACQSSAPPRAATAKEPVMSSVQHCTPITIGKGLQLVVLGSGGPRAAGRAASSYAVIIDGTPRYLVDAGPGAFARLGESGLDQSQLDTILLTHLHVDHAGDVPGLIKSRDLLSKDPLAFRIFGPTGAGLYPSTSEFMERLTGERGAFAYLPTFRNPMKINAHDVTFDLSLAPKTIIEERGVTITAASVDHRDVPALAYRIEYGGASVVVTGDLASRRSQIGALARGATLLVYDAAVREPPGSPSELYELHTPPSRIGEVAAEAGVKSLVLSHIAPDVEKHQDELLRTVKSKFTGSVVMATDCMQPLVASHDSASATHRVIFEVTASDPKQWESVLSNVENVRKALGETTTEVRVVAHGGGLDMLLAASKAEPRISKMIKDGVVFAACANTMKRKNVTNAELLAGATTVDSGVAEVVRRQEQGWSYVKGG